MIPIDVCAAVIVRDGRVLLATRPDGTHLVGKWEFPGGKVHDGESLTACIRREIREELGLDVLEPVHLRCVTHQYPEKAIRLHFLLCTVRADCEPVCHEGQEARWVTPEELRGLDLAPADRVFLDSGTPQCECWEKAAAHSHGDDTLRTLEQLFA